MGGVGVGAAVGVGATLGVWIATDGVALTGGAVLVQPATAQHARAIVGIERRVFTVRLFRCLRAGADLSRQPVHRHGIPDPNGPRGRSLHRHGDDPARK